MKQQVVFIGAGPVGLMSAIALKKANPELDVVMLERYTYYERKHNLKLDLNNVADLILRKELEALGKDDNAGVKLHGSEMLIPIQTLEEFLKDKAINLGIKTVQKTLVDDNKADKKQNDICQNPTT